jgi:hypothetical protein
MSYGPTNGFHKALAKTTRVAVVGATFALVVPGAGGGTTGQFRPALPIGPRARSISPRNVAPLSFADPIPVRPEFLRDVAPILDHSGCSTAECHGKFGGRGGFQLSLLTLSPEDDFSPIVDGGRGRRVNFAAPEQSLLLRKATGQVPHAGGMRFAVGSTEYRTILRWLRFGAPFRDSDARLSALAVSPPQATLPKVGATAALKVLATFSDGSTRDVTDRAVFQTTNDAVVRVGPDGRISAARWGGGAVIARYLGTVSAAFVTVPQARKGAYPGIPAGNIVDKLVFSNLKRLNVLPSGLSTDEEFLRRVTLDTLGRLPSPAERAAFLADGTPDKRDRLIERLLDSTEYADLRSLRLCDLLRVNPRKFGNQNASLADRSAQIFYDWIHRSVRENKPWDRFVRELITARGSTYIHGPTNFYRVERTPNDRMENMGQALLGVRMSCARCHKHPFDRWTTDDYWNFAAAVGKVSTRNGRLLDELIIGANPGAQVRNQSVNGRSRGKVAPPTYLGEATPAASAPDPVEALADWVVSPENRFFARATVNRLWSYYFGRGIVHPVDDMRATSPESVPGLLEALSRELVDHRYDTRHLTKLILSSRTYQLTSRPNESNRLDDRFFSRSFARPMPAQVVVDMVNQATGARESFGTFPERSRAVQASLPSRMPFLNAFGQSHREFLADINPKLEPTLTQTLMMINSPYVESKIRQGATATDVSKQASGDDDILRRLYLLTLCREPTSEEMTRAKAILAEEPNHKEGAQDLLWALITSREFFFNH